VGIKLRGSGCSGLLSQLYGKILEFFSKGEFPYILRGSILTVNEYAFYQELSKVVGNKYVIQSKVRLADIFDVGSSKNWRRAFNKISQRHVDFLLCLPDSFKPVLAIELDDIRHKRKDRQEKDAFENQLFSNSGNLPLLRIKARMHYDVFEIRDFIVRELGLRNKS
jgi:hypothetical protein